MKASKYNFFYNYVTNEQQMIAYNARTNALALIDNDNYKKYINFIKYNTKINDENLLQELKRGQFIIDDEICELDLVRYSILNSRYSESYLGMTIAPTLNCNFKCVYCYEKDSLKNTPMCSEVQEKIIELIHSYVGEINSLHITWYGGEPLLELDTILRLSKIVMKICEQNQIVYTSNIITNGYNLDKNTALILKECNINKLQITIDGPQEIHDVRRPLISGQGTFNRILKNLTEITEIIKEITIRINIDNENILRINETFQSFDEYGLRNKIGLYLGQVVSMNNCYRNSTCTENALFSKLNYMFEKSLIENGYKKNLISKYPNRKSNFCGADYKNNLVIDPEGYIYKCWADIGIVKYAVGNILDKNFKGNYARYLSYMIYDPTLDETCKDCSYLPICMGGCPKKRLENNMRCTEYKYALEPYLREIATTLDINYKK